MVAIVLRLRPPTSVSVSFSPLRSCTWRSPSKMDVSARSPRCRPSAPCLVGFFLRNWSSTGFVAWPGLELRLLSSFLLPKKPQMERRPRVCGVVEAGAWRHCRPPGALVSNLLAHKRRTATHHSAAVAVKAYGRSLCVICASALVVDGLDDSLQLPWPPRR